MINKQNDINLLTAEKETKQFRTEVLKGLTAPQKFLQSKYFYDKAGDLLFQQIMACDEYYLTRCEMETFTEQTKPLAREIIRHLLSFDVVELGAGDASKSIFLLKELLSNKISFTYYPVDISNPVIKLLHRELPAQLPHLKVHGLNGDYFSMLEKANSLSSKPKLVLFLGSNIGNIPLADAEMFCTKLRRHLSPGDLLLIGFDLKKDPELILGAYDDSAGYTRDFNLNILKRINNELEADFDIESFYHYPTYDPQTGACKSFLVSKRQQTATLHNHAIDFEKGETIFTEISQKYTLKQTDEMASRSGFTPIKHFFDSKGWFLDAIWLAK